MKATSNQGQSVMGQRNVCITRNQAIVFSQEMLGLESRPSALVMAHLSFFLIRCNTDSTYWRFDPCPVHPENIVGRHVNHSGGVMRGLRGWGRGCGGGAVKLLH